MATKIKLNNGREMPMVGLGTYSRQAAPGQCRQAVEWAIEAGYRHIDTASSYNNEVEVGEGINNKINDGTVERRDLFVTTKLWNDAHAPAAVVPALQESLRRLQLDYVDLFLVHWPFSVKAASATLNKNDDAGIDYTETWTGMQQARALGLARSIGVSNFNEHQVLRLAQTDCKPVVNQVEINPTNTQHRLVNACLQSSVVPVAYTPLGLLSDARPEFEGKSTIKTDEKLRAVAEKYGKTVEQVALRYLIQRGIPVIPKSYTKARIVQNLQIFDFALTESEMALVDGFNIDHRCVPAAGFKHLTNYPFV
ncbi:unnamed protein product [Plutella xylostella]|uniref:(diamondback moth) hypothetical protein n=1 Tax=Plutella xylostella TaxID=51655 RepID=A0A8S4DRM3_PLUXY|nr:unnamed protein product [Plutella xylostella]